VFPANAQAPRPAAGPARPAPPNSARTPSLPTPQLAGDDSLPIGCPRCNARMEANDDLCNACGYHLILKKVIDISDMKQRSRATGFERMLEGQLHESETSASAMLWLKIVGCIGLVVVLFLCLGAWWWVGVLAVAGGGALYWSTYRKKAAQSAAGESTVNKDPVAGLIWSILLGIERIIGWRQLTWPFKAVKSLTLTDPSFHDGELPDLSGLNELEALDLEGTGVSDEGLRYLSNLKQLQFLVIRRTKVTSDGASRLQRDLPNCLVWY
jgi:hypothetical protein